MFYYYNKSSKAKGFINKTYLLYSYVQVRRNGIGKSKVKNPIIVILL